MKLPLPYRYLSSLPRKEFYLVKDLAEFFQVAPMTIQRHAKAHQIGTLKRTGRGARGTYIFKRRDHNPPQCDILRLYGVIKK